MVILYCSLDMMNNPLTTKCGHSFCSDCISQVVKGPRNSSQCPICVSNITKRSLSKNTKKIALVLAVRKVIDSIKRDCCFEGLCSAVLIECNFHSGLILWILLLACSSHLCGFKNYSLLVELIICASMESTNVQVIHYWYYTVKLCMHLK